MMTIRRTGLRFRDACATAGGVGAFRSPRGGFGPGAALAAVVMAATPAWATDKCGEVGGEVWSVAGSPYVVTCDVTVAAGTTLLVDAGVEVRFRAGTGMTVGGTLNVNGDSANPANFTSDSSSPHVRDWTSVTLRQSATGLIRHASFRYADYGIHVTDSASATLTGVTATSNYFGMGVSGGGPPSVTASGCRFVDNEWIGVLVETTAAERCSTALTIVDSEIHGNGRDDIYAGESLPDEHPGVLVMARGNYWGTTDAATIGHNVFDSKWHRNAATVDFCDFLDAPGGSPARNVHCPDLIVCDGQTDVWDQTDMPYLLTSGPDIFGTLTIGPGVEVRAPAVPVPDGCVPGKVGIWVHSGGGVLNVDGSPGSPVTLTSDSSTPAMSDWTGLIAGGTIVLDDAVVSYADKNSVLDGSLSLTNTTLRNHRIALEILAGWGGTVVVTGSELAHNDEYGVYIFADPEPSDPMTLSLRDSSIHDNGLSNVHVDPFVNPTETALDFRDNWWGTTDTAAIAAAIHDYNDDVASPLVDWCGFLDGPGGAPALDAHCPDLAVCGETSIWDRTDKPYLLVSDLIVCPTGTLQVGPGVEARAAVASPEIGVHVLGTLDVDGTPASPVTFRSNAAAPAPSDWSGVWFLGNSTGDLRESAIRHADVGLYAADAATIAMDGVSITHNAWGLRVQGSGPPALTVVNSAITDNSYNGVEVERVAGSANPSLTVTHSSIHSNGGWQYFADTFNDPAQTTLDATANWWGTTDTSLIAMRIHDHSDEYGSPVVDWCGYLDGPGGTGRSVHCPSLYMCGGTYAWNLTDKPYLITSDLYVCPSATLVISPDVDVLVASTGSALEFLVEGTLDSNGTELLPVTLTSDAAVPAANDWGGVRLAGNAVATLDHTTIRHAGDALHAQDGASLHLVGVTATESQTGLNVYGNGPPTVTATGCSFVENAGYGVHVRRQSGYSNPTVSIRQSSIHSNAASYDLLAQYYENPDTTVFDARNNWWGTTNTAAIGPRIYDHRATSSSPRVDWCGYLDGPGGAPVVAAHCPDLVVCDETVVFDRTDLPYQVTTDFWVCPTGTLRVEPGVDVRIVKTTPVPDFLVEGALDVNGTLAAPATFRSNAPAPAAGDWDGPLFRASSVATIDHAEFLHATNGLDVGGASNVTLHGVTARRNTTGLRVYGSGPPTLQATGSSFVENAYYGVQLQRQSGYPNPVVSIHDCSMHSNTGPYDLLAQYYENPDTTVFDARNNWWGTTDTAAIGPRIYDHRATNSSPRVDWCGYLDGPGGAPARAVVCPDLVVCDETVVFDRTDLPYQVTTDFWVCPTGTLQVEPGVDVRIVKTTTRPDFLVEGTMDVNGASGTPVLFGSDAPAPAAGDWDGPLFRASSVATIDHAEFLHATNGLDVGGASNVTLHGVTARRNTTGLRVYGSGPPTLQATGSSFVENAYYGVQLQRQSGYPNPAFTMTRSSIHSNAGPYDFLAQYYDSPDTALVWATDNWWGTTDPAAIATRIYDHDESTSAPRVRFRAFGIDCEYALGDDRDRDRLADFDDNCPGHPNATQTDTDLDGMGDACDPAPATAPSFACDGVDDVLDGWLDADGDGWGDPCDFHPLRADSHPGAAERCDARDNDGDAGFASGERTDDDLDFGVACGDCDDLEPLANVCACEACGNSIDDDCDLLADAADDDCRLFDLCVVLVVGGDPRVTMHKGECGGATLTDPHDHIRGHVGALAFASGSVDLGPVECVAADHPWDRVTERSINPNPRCEPVPVLFYLAKPAAAPDYGAASSGERRDTMEPNPACVP